MKKPANLLLITAALFCLSSLFATRTEAQQPKPNILPHVAGIGESDEATGNSWSGCDNHYLIPRNESFEHEPIFISNADGSIAWMNLNGRNMGLESVKTTLWYRRHGSAFARYEYRSGRILITVSFPQYSDYVSEYRAKIVLRRGRAVRTINAVGLPQCDLL